jgi:hypothetical protein
MNTGGFLLQDNMRGMIISQRPAEILAIKSSQLFPFVSRVKNSSPLGLPPIMNSIVFPIKKQVNYVDMKNKEVIRKLQTLKKYEKEAITDEEKNVKIKYEKARDNSIRQNATINKLRKDLYGDLVASNDEIKNSQKFGLTTNNFFDKSKSESRKQAALEDDVNMGGNLEINANTSKQDNYNYIPSATNNINVAITHNPANSVDYASNSKRVNFNLPPLDDFDKDDNEDEVNNLLNFVNNLDYEKYAKDLEIREALYLIKNKVEKDKANCPNDEEIKNDENLRDNILGEESKHIEGYQNSANVNYFNHIQNSVNHEREWDNSVKTLIL